MLNNYDEIHIDGLKIFAHHGADFLAFSSVFTVLRDRVFHTTLMISSQPRYDHFDTSPY